MKIGNFSALTWLTFAGPVTYTYVHVMCVICHYSTREGVEEESKGTKQG